MNGIREPSAHEERGIATRSAHLKALLDAARAAGLTGYAAYLWDSSRPAEPCIVVSDVHIHCETVEELVYAIGLEQPRFVSVTRVDVAVRSIRDVAEGRCDPRTPQPF